METIRIVPCSNHECRRSVGSYAEDADQAWRNQTGESFQLGFQVLDLLAKLTVTAGKGSKSVLGRRRGIVQTTRMEARASRREGSCGETVEGFAQLSWGRNDQGFHLVNGLGASLYSRDRFRLLVGYKALYDEILKLKWESLNSHTLQTNGTFC